MIPTAAIPAETCYWVVLPPSPRRWTRDRIISGIEPWIASAVDRLDLAWHATSDGRMLVVAVEPERLDAALAATPGAWSATPDRIPDHVVLPGVEPADLNLLTGTRAPPQFRQLERHLAIATVAVSTLAVILLFVGTWRQTAGLRSDRLAVAASGEQQLTAALPAALCGNDPDPLLRLDQAQRLTSALVHAAEGSAGGSAALFTALLAAWPADLRAQVANLSVDGNRCTISGTAASVEHTQRLSAALTAALAAQPGWRMLPLQAVTGTGSVTFTCTMVREGA
jgi:hypothetical protein